MSRDRTRTAEAKGRRMTRRSERRLKSALALLCLAFPGQL